MKDEKNYPSWVCTKCAEAAGGAIPPAHLPTWHIGECGVCLETKTVTQPRDFRYPDFKSLIARRALTKEAQERGEYDNI